MSVEFLSPDEALRFLHLLQQSYRPPQIVKLQQEIEAETKAAELRYSVTGSYEPEVVDKIVHMKFEVDRLCVAWARGQL